MKKSIKVIELILIIAICFLVILLGFMFLNKKNQTPKGLFKKYFLSNFEQIENVLPKSYGKLSNKLKDNASEVNIKTFSNIKDTEDNKTELNINIKNDLKNNVASVSVSKNEDSKKLFNTTLLKQENKYGILTDGIDDKYIAIENKNLRKLFGNLYGIDEENLNDFTDEIPEIKYFSNDEKKKMKDLFYKYLLEILEQIPDQNYSIDKDADIEVNNKIVETKRYTLSLKTNILFNMLNNAVDNFFNDSEFIKLCENRISTEQIKTIKDIIAYNFYEIEENLSEDTVSEISIYVKGKKIVKTEISVDNRYIEFFINNDKKSSEVYIKYIIYKNEFNNVSQKNTLVIKNNSEEISIQMNVDYDENEIKSLEKEEEDIKYYYPNKDISFTGKLPENSDDFYINGILKENNNEIANINIEGKFSNINIEKMTSDNSIIINDYSMEQLDELLNEYNDVLKIFDEKIQEYSIIYDMLKFMKLPTELPICYLEYNEEDMNAFINGENTDMEIIYEEENFDNTNTNEEDIIDTVEENELENNENIITNENNDIN